MVRHHDAIDTLLHRLARIFGIEDALDDQRPRPFLADEIKILPRDRWIEIAAQPVEEIIEPRLALQRRRNIAEMVRPAQQPDIPRPPRTLRCLKRAPARTQHARRTRHARAPVAITRSR